MKTNNKLNAYILRGSTTALLLSCVIVALCSAINLPKQPPKALPPQDSAAFDANGQENRSLSFEDRVAYQRAIEEVYWRHRIWPKERPDRRPALDTMMSQAAIEQKVQDYLRHSELLEQEWQRPITPEQLQAEMDRMAQHSKQPEVLQELFAALGNDPFVIAECLARPVLADRLLIRSATDEQLEQASRTSSKVEAATTSNTMPSISNPVSGCTDDTWTATTQSGAPDGRDFHTAIWTGVEMIVWGGGDN